MSQVKIRYHFNNLYAENPLQFQDIRLIQIGRIYCDFDAVIPEHIHGQWYELTLVRNGVGIVTTNGEARYVKEGEIYLSSPYDIHKIEAAMGSRLEYDFFAFYPTDPDIAQCFEQILSTLCGVQARVFQDEKIAYLVGNAIAEFPIKKDDTPELLTHIFHQILIYIRRDFFKEQEKRWDHITENEMLCYQMMNYIDTHMMSLKKLEDLASYFNYNYSYLSELFHATTGNTLFQYFQNKRMEAAKILVLEKKKKIEEIAELFHYSSPFAFSKAFRKKYGISPKIMQKTAEKQKKSNHQGEEMLTI